jgi:hypothetical protein
MRRPRRKGEVMPIAAEDGGLSLYLSIRHTLTKVATDKSSRLSYNDIHAFTIYKNPIHEKIDRP